MSVLNPSHADHVDAIAFESVTIETELFPPVDIAATITDLDVFEHLDKPYVTAVLGFVDIEDLVGGMNLSGGERVSVTLKTNIEDSIPVIKIFYIDKVVSSNKTSGNEEFFTLHLIEDIAFKSNLLNVNKSYTGKTSKIVKKIAKDFLDAKVDIMSSDIQDAKVIVPNLTPMDAMCWVKNRSTTSDGYPYYLFSNLIDFNLQFIDLQTMMTAKVMNDQEGAEFTHYESQMGSETSLGIRRVIMAYQARDNYDLYSLIDKGLLGAEYRYLDVIKKEDNKFEFDIDKEVNDLLDRDSIVTKRQYPPYDSARYDWSTDKISSRKITRIGSSEIFNDNQSLSQRKEVAQYRLNEVSRAMAELLKSEAMTFVVNGLDFFDGAENTTIGNKLRIRFLKNSITDDADKFDHKKSGDYLIFACKHSFTQREYTLTFSGVKLSNGEVV